MSNSPELDESEFQSDFAEGVASATKASVDRLVVDLFQLKFETPDMPDILKMGAGIGIIKAIADVSGETDVQPFLDRADEMGRQQHPDMF